MKQRQLREKPLFYDETNEQSYLQMWCVLGHTRPQIWQRPKVGVARKLYTYKKQLAIKR